MGRTSTVATDSSGVKLPHWDSGLQQASSPITQPATLSSGKLNGKASITDVNINGSNGTDFGFSPEPVKAEMQKMTNVNESSEAKLPHERRPAKEKKTSKVEETRVVKFPHERILATDDGKALPIKQTAIRATGNVIKTANIPEHTPVKKSYRDALASDTKRKQPQHGPIDEGDESDDREYRRCVAEQRKECQNKEGEIRALITAALPPCMRDVPRPVYFRERKARAEKEQAAREKAARKAAGIKEDEDPAMGMVCMPTPGAILGPTKEDVRKEHQKKQDFLPLPVVMLLPRRELKQELQVGEKSALLIKVEIPAQYPSEIGPPQVDAASIVARESGKSNNPLQVSVHQTDHILRTGEEGCLHPRIGANGHIVPNSVNWDERKQYNWNERKQYNWKSEEHSMKVTLAERQCQVCPQAAL